MKNWIGVCVVAVGLATMHAEAIGKAVRKAATTGIAAPTTRPVLAKLTEVGQKHAAGPIRSGDRQWEATATPVPGEYLLDLAVREKKTGRKRVVFEAVRTISFFWTAIGDRQLLVINDHGGSDFSRCLVADPSTGNRWDVDLDALQNFDPRDELHHCYSHAVAASPDGRRLLLSLSGYGDVGERERYTVVDTLTGRILKNYRTEAQVPGNWYEIPEPKPVSRQKRNV